jgi:hypothetical protein
VGGLEVGHSDGARPAVGEDLFQGLPGLDVQILCGDRPVDEEEVDVVEAERGEGCVDGAQSLVVAVVKALKLGGDEDVLARDPGVADAAPDGVFVAVGGRGVDEAVAAAQGAGDGLLGVGAPQGPGAQSEAWHGDAVVELDGGGCRGFHARALW